jgi:predicted DsbA family dithiol-disulfide isomerase
MNILVDIAKKNNITENIFKDFINEKNIELVNSNLSTAREKNINGVPFFEIGKDFISGAQSSIQLENVIKANLI